MIKTKDRFSFIKYELNERSANSLTDLIEKVSPSEYCEIRDYAKDLSNSFKAKITKLIFRGCVTVTALGLTGRIVDYFFNVEGLYELSKLMITGGSINSIFMVFPNYYTNIDPRRCIKR
jgi:hypothetical protein